MAEVLRTDDVTQADRFAQWRHWISATFVPPECAPVSREPFRGEVAHWELGGLLVSRVAARPHLASRTRRMIALRDAGYYKVGLLTRGSCRLSQEGREALLRPGDLAIYDCRRPYTMMWMARRYQAPSLTVILDNQGWKAPSLSTLAVHPAGELAAGGFAASFQPEADLPEVAAAAGGAYARTVTAAARLPEALGEALARVRGGRSAVVSVHIAPV